MTASNEPASSNVIDLVAAMQARGWDDPTGSKPGPSRRHPPRSKAALFRIKIELEDTQVWRVVDIRSDANLEVVHDVFQVSMGWSNSHLHMFAKGPALHDPTSENYLMAFSIEDGEKGVPEIEVRLDEVLAEESDRIFYWYDYGDSWEHTITLQQILPLPADAPSANCVDGSGACPPEDCGGIPGYQRLCDVVADPTDPEAAELMAWAGDWDPMRFDIGRTNANLEAWSKLPLGLMTLADPGYGLPVRLADLMRRLRGSMARTLLPITESANLRSDELPAPDVVAAMVRPFQWLLDRVGSAGLVLTAAGYLKPDDVLACATELGIADEWFGKFNRKSQTYPVLEFRESVQKLGLLRKFRGRMVQTANGKKVAHDSVALWRYLATKVPYGNDCEQDAGILVLLLVAAGEPIEMSDVSLSRRPWLGNRAWTADYRSRD